MLTPTPRSSPSRWAGGTPSMPARSSGRHRARRDPVPAASGSSAPHLPRHEQQPQHQDRTLPLSHSIAQHHGNRRRPGLREAVRPRSRRPPAAHGSCPPGDAARAQGGHPCRRAGATISIAWRIRRRAPGWMTSADRNSAASSAPTAPAARARDPSACTDPDTRHRAHRVSRPPLPPPAAPRTSRPVMSRDIASASWKLLQREFSPPRSRFTQSVRSSSTVLRARFVTCGDTAEKRSAVDRGVRGVSGRLQRLDGGRATHRGGSAPHGRPRPGRRARCRPGRGPGTPPRR